jgi:hypothetical protein
VHGVAAPAATGITAGGAVRFTLAQGAVAAAGLRLQRRLPPLDRRRSGVLLGAAVGAIPALFMPLTCMYDPQHTLLLHLGPARGVAAAGFVLGPLLLRRI